VYLIFVSKEKVEKLGVNFYSIGCTAKIPFGFTAGFVGIGIGGIASLIKGPPKATFIIKIDYINGEHLPISKID
jgi:hypothetical protein